MALLLVTGGSGYLGSELVEQAQLAGWQVAATYYQHPPEPLQARSVHYLPLDLRQPTAASDLIMSLQPTAIIHTAYLQSGPDLFPITAEGARLVAEAAAMLGIRLIHLSSDVIFDGEQERPYTEADPPAPVSDYGRAKALAEQYVQFAHPQALIARTSLIYGGLTKSKHEQLILAAADGQSEMAFFTDEIRCPVQVADLAQGLLELTSRNEAGVLHLAGSEVLSRYEFAYAIAIANQRNPTQLRAARSADSPVRRPRNCVLDTQKARQILKTELRGVRAVLGTPSERFPAI